MRITDALRGETATLLEVASFVRRIGAVGEAGGAGEAGEIGRAGEAARILEGLLVELLDSHRQAIEPLIRSLEARLGPSGLMLVVRCEQARLERQLRDLAKLAVPSRISARDQLGARFADVLAIELALLLPLAESALPEERLEELGERSRGVRVGRIR